MNFAQRSKGFTLIELLVVIAIIGILATIVLVSLSSARESARDSRRVGDLRQIALALELYYDSNVAYPDDGNATGCDDSLAALTTSGFMSSVPADPQGGAYLYESDGDTYVLGATLENASNNALNSDINGTVLSCNCADPVYCIQP